MKPKLQYIVHTICLKFPEDNIFSLAKEWVNYCLVVFTNTTTYKSYSFTTNNPVEDIQFVLRQMFKNQFCHNEDHIYEMMSSFPADDLLREQKFVEKISPELNSINEAWKRLVDRYYGIILCNEDTSEYSITDSFLANLKKNK